MPLGSKSNTKLIYQPVYITAVSITTKVTRSDPEVKKKYSTDKTNSESNDYHPLTENSFPRAKKPILNLPADCCRKAVITVVIALMSAALTVMMMSI